MKKIFLLFTLFAIIFLAILCKPAENPISTSTLPPPTNGTIVKLDAEDQPKSAARKAWFELMHQAPPGIDWREAEKENLYKQIELKQSLRKNKQHATRDGELVANGNLEGVWRERGSNNQAGNMLGVNYFVEEDMFIGRSGGGSLWKGDRSGFNWEVINHDYIFESDVYEARYNDAGNIRYIAALNAQIVYSDDGGETWTPAEGMATSVSARIGNFIEHNDGTMMVMHKDLFVQKMGVYISTDNGTTWERTFEFSTPSMSNLKITNVYNSDDIVAIEQLNIDLTRIHKWNHNTKEFEVIRENSDVGFGPDDPANIQATFADDSLRLYVRNHENKLHLSTDTAKTWRVMSNLATNPWSVGFYVSPSNYKNIFYGEVNAYKSSNEGRIWGKINNWSEYYSDVIGKLHADIMNIREFKDADGNPFLVMCNHGGLSESYDGGETFTNKGLYTLNISQYYSVVTHPTNQKWVFAGSQDQGFQRGVINGDNQIEMDQVISGDYGHIVFSSEDDNMWTVYPGGSVSYYAQPTSHGPTVGWKLESETESVWIPPLLGHPDKSQNSIFMAGGNINGSAGSYMIRLDIDHEGIISPSQFDYNFRQFGGEISAMDISHFDNDLIFVSTTTGNIFKSDDGGQSFERKEINLPGSHYLYGSCIKTSLIDKDVIYISGSGYGAPAVYKSIDGGETFLPMNNGMPSTLVFCLAPNEDESLIFAATEAGPFVYVTALDEWFDLSGAGTPYQTYWSVEYLSESQTARFGTYGRGIWDFEVGGIISDIEDIKKENIEVNISPNPFTDRIVLTSDLKGKCDIQITDQQGKRVMSFTNKPLNNLELDLRNLSTSIYFVTINVNKKTVTKQIVKQ